MKLIKTGAKDERQAVEQHTTNGYKAHECELK